MKILLLGYGKMGKAIETIANTRQHVIVGKIHDQNKHELTSFNAKNTDVAIEFSQPEAAFENIKYCLENGIPVISGTTGWLDKKPEIEQLCQRTSGTFFYASNYSIGVNLFFRLNQHFAQIMDRFEEYDVDIEEIHHTEKKDAPSGTAITLAEDIIGQVNRKDRWVNETSNLHSDLVIKSLREGNVPGTHTVHYHSGIDSIELKHTAHSREGFAKGALLVAEWARDKKGNLTMNDFLKV